MDENLPVTPGTPRDDSFDTAVRGFNRQQVMEYMTRSNQHIAMLEQHLSVARADVQRVRSEAEQAQSEVRRLLAEAESKPVHEEVSGRLSQILRLAAEEADQERATADAEIAELRSQSKAESERLLAEARAEAEKDLAEARATGERELTEARSTAERDLTAAREEADRLRLASVRQTQELLDEAQRRAGAVNEVSNQRLETLTATHGEAVLRLGQIRDVLADLLDRDSAAGSLAQVVEAVIAPPGSTTPELTELAEFTERAGQQLESAVYEPAADQTAAYEAVPDPAGSGSDEPVRTGFATPDDGASAALTAQPASDEEGEPKELLPIAPPADTAVDLRDRRSGVGSHSLPRR